MPSFTDYCCHWELCEKSACRPGGKWRFRGILCRCFRNVLRKKKLPILKSMIQSMQICEIRIGPLKINSLLISVMTVKMDVEFHVNFILFLFSHCHHNILLIVYECSSPLVVVSVTAVSRESGHLPLWPPLFFRCECAKKLACAFN